MSIDVNLAAEHLFTLDVQASADAYRINGPTGPRRMIAPVLGGAFEGARLRGSVAPTTGGDWARVDSYGTVRVDVRIVLLTDDDAVIYMSYTGVLDGQDLRTATSFETGDERYTWLNQVQGVGIGRLDGRTVRYEVYALR